MSLYGVNLFHWIAVAKENRQEVIVLTDMYLSSATEFYSGYSQPMYSKWLSPVPAYNGWKDANELTYYSVLIKNSHQLVHPEEYSQIELAQLRNKLAKLKLATYQTFRINNKSENFWNFSKISTCLSGQMN